LAKKPEYQTWTLAGLLATKEIMTKHIELLSFEEEIESPWVVVRARRATTTAPHRYG